MDGAQALNELKRLNFEDYLWILVASLAFVNILGNLNEKDFVKTNNPRSKFNANKAFEFTLLVSLIIYIYFFYRNYAAYQRAKGKDKDLFLIKILGSSLFIAATLCLIYFQFNDPSFIGSPAI